MRKKVKLVIIIIFMVLCLIINNYSNENIKTKISNKNFRPNRISNKKFISIPKINLYHEIVKAEDNFKNLNNNIVYYKNLNVDEKIILFGHSGIGFGTYFNRIDELIIGDIIYLYVNNKKYNYIVINTYLISKYDVDILSNDSDKELLLITCDKKNKDNRLVVKLKLNT